MLKRMKDLREERDLTQNELAKILGIARSNISKYEHGELDPSTEILKKYADYFGCTVDYIIGRTNNRNEVITKPDDYSIVVVKAKDAKIPANVLNEYIEFLKTQIPKKD